MIQILQITSGKGPAECSWVVAQILKLILNEARGLGIDAIVLHREEGEENGTLISASLQLEGERINEFVKTWAGTIQWIGQSQYRKGHKRNNWFVGVDILPVSDEEFQINEKDISYQAIRASGPGGQHVNKVSTAIRATHVPTGLAVLASESRSQIQNKKKSKERLLNYLKVDILNKKQEQLKAGWKHQLELERGNPVRVFKGSDFKPQSENKKYKSQRQSLKSDLRKRIVEDE